MMWSRYDRNTSGRKALLPGGLCHSESGLKDPESLTILRANFPATA
jgi:hypothetical protein